MFQQKKTLLACALSLICNSFLVKAETVQEVDSQIVRYYKEINPSLPIDKKVALFSKLFLGQPYILGALGEGNKGKYDQSPLYRLNGFDCTTYVETVLGLSYSSSLNQFKKRIVEVRYHSKQPSYLTRNHFTSLDWNPNNIQKGFIRDIASRIVGLNDQPIFKVATATINKKAWLSHKKIEDIKISPLTLKASRLASLKNAANKFPPKQAKINYLPLSKLFTSQGKPISFIFNQIPNSSIIEIVRPNWQLLNKIGTNLNVSHLGFGIRKNKILYFREASSIEGKVIDIPLTKYLSAYINSPTIKGIAVFAPVEPHKAQIS